MDNFGEHGLQGNGSHDQGMRVRIMDKLRKYFAMAVMLLFIVMVASVLFSDTEASGSTVPLGDAIDQGNVTAETKGRGAAGGFIAEMTITNTGDSAITVSLKPSGLEGRIMRNPNSNEQDQVIIGVPGVKVNDTSHTVDETVTIEPGENVTVVIIGFCINLALDNPSNEVGLELNDSSEKGNINEIGPIISVLEEFAFPGNFISGQIIKLKQLAIWFSQSENSDVTRDTYAAKGYPLTDEEIAVLKDLLMASGMTQEDVDQHNGFTNAVDDPNTNGDDDDEDDGREIYGIPEDQCYFMVGAALVLWVIYRFMRFASSAGRKPTIREAPLAAPPAPPAPVSRPTNPATGQPCATVHEGAVWIPPPAPPPSQPAPRPTDAAGQPCATVHEGAVWTPPPGQPPSTPAPRPTDAAGQPCATVKDGAVWTPPPAQPPSQPAPRPTDAAGQPCATVKDGAVWTPPPAQPPSQPAPRPADAAGQPCATVKDGVVWTPPPAQPPSQPAPRPTDAAGQPCATVKDGAVWTPPPAQPPSQPAPRPTDAGGQPCATVKDGAVWTPPPAQPPSQPAPRPADAAGQPCATVHEGAVWKPPEPVKDPATGQPCGIAHDGSVYKPPERPKDPNTGQTCATVDGGAVWKPPEPVKDPATGQPCGIAHDGSVYKPPERPKDPNTGQTCATVSGGAVWKKP